MLSCLMCLKIIDDKLGCIGVNSTQWQQLDVGKKIEKHFWALINIQPNSSICLSCWQEVDDFHKFYLSIEDAHMTFCKIKSEYADLSVAWKQELFSQIPNATDNDEESDKEMTAHCFLEQEMLIDQHQALGSMTELDIQANEGTAIIAPPDEICKDYMPKPENATSCIDPLEKSKTLDIGKSKKRKRSKGKIAGEEKSIHLKIKEEPVHFYGNDSECVNDNDENIKNKEKEKQRANRIENDKFIAEHFKHMFCDLCQVPFEDFVAMQKHYIQAHQQRGYVVCCKRKFYNRRLLVDHIHCHLNPDHFKCDKCGKVLTDRLLLEKHKMRVHSEEGIKKHCCDQCGKSFAVAHYLRRHKFTHLSTEEKKFPCNECGKFYGSAYLLHRHMQAVHLRKFVKICYICGKYLHSGADFKIHMDKHEGKPQPIISCDVCGLLLTSERGLKKHKDGQHPADGKKEHHCPTCPKISPTLKALRKHISTMHEKGYEYKCTICDRAFKRAEVLKEHIASHTGTPLYTCSWCPKTFNSNGNMHAHRKKMHPKEWEEIKLQKYALNITSRNIVNNDVWQNE